MKRLSLIFSAIAALITAALVAQAQVPGVNSTLNTIFTLAYDGSTMKPTYSAGGGALGVATTATDFCILTGSATRNIRVRRVFVSGGATAVATDPIVFFKRSTLGTSATPISIPAVGYDSNNAAGTAIMDVWVGAGTVGTPVGVIADLPLTFNNYTTGTGVAIDLRFGERGSPVVLRSASEALTVNGSGSLPAGVSVQCTFEWTEESPSAG